MLEYRQVGERLQGGKPPRQSGYVKAQQNRQAEAAARRFILSSAVLTERVNADHQTGDCEQDIEQLNIRHAHHLRFCIAAAEATTP